MEAGSGVISFSGNTYGNRVEVTTTKISQFLLSSFDASGSQSIFANGSAGGTNALGGTNISTNAELLRSGSFAGEYFDGKIQELILYNSNQSSNRASIETNINNHYSIY
jgi:hypothetical protein